MHASVPYIAAMPTDRTAQRDLSFLQKEKTGRVAGLAMLTFGAAASAVGTALVVAGGFSCMPLTTAFTLVSAVAGLVFGFDFLAGNYWEDKDFRDQRRTEALNYLQVDGSALTYQQRLEKYAEEIKHNCFSAEDFEHWKEQDSIIQIVHLERTNYTQAKEMHPTLDRGSVQAHVDSLFASHSFKDLLINPRVGLSSVIAFAKDGFLRPEHKDVIQKHTDEMPVAQIISVFGWDLIESGALPVNTGRFSVQYKFWEDVDNTSAQNLRDIFTNYGGVQDAWKLFDTGIAGIELLYHRVTQAISEQGMTYDTLMKTCGPRVLEMTSEDRETAQVVYNAFMTYCKVNSCDLRELSQHREFIAMMNAESYNSLLSGVKGIYREYLEETNKPGAMTYNNVNALNSRFSQSLFPDLGPSPSAPPA
jgi:hypothetical protein